MDIKDYVGIASSLLMLCKDIMEDLLGPAWYAAGKPFLALTAGYEWRLESWASGWMG